MILFSTKACNELCWVCSDSNADKCDQCSDKAFRYGASCVSSCPSGYQENKSFRVCMLDSPLIGEKELDYGNTGWYSQDRIDPESTNGCLIGYYYDYKTKQCQSCNSTACKTCDYGTANSCTYCNLNYYLTGNNTCEDCSIKPGLQMNYLG